MFTRLFRNKKTTFNIGPKKTDVTKELARYERIFRGSRGYGFVDWDLDVKTVIWHGGFWEHLGYNKEEIKTIDDPSKFLELIHPEERKDYLKNLIDILKNKATGDLLVRVAKKDGEYVSVELRLAAFRKANGRASHLSGVIFDISALKHTEQALRSTEARHARIIQSSNDGIWEWSAREGGRILKITEDKKVEWNSFEGDKSFTSRVWDMLGYPKDHEYTKQGLYRWRKLMHEDDGKHFDQKLLKHVISQTPFEVEYRVRGYDGNWVWILARGQLHYNSQGNPTIFSGTNMNITALKYAEEKVKRAREEAEKANNEKSVFLSNMSHELRTPLNAILGFSQLLELDTELSARQRENLLEIKSAGQHLLELIGDILDLAKIESGHITFSSKRVLPARIITECAALLKSQIEKEDLSLTINLNSADTDAILADEIRLRQVFLNLLANAVKYNKKKGSVIVNFSKLDNNTLKIEIEDSGMGIPKQLQPNLFQAFNRLGAEDSNIEGSGVGLAITKQLVEKMGGALGFTSQESLGSKFWVTFPSLEDSLTEDSVNTPSDFLAKGSDNKLPELKLSDKKSILYVEDNLSNQKLIKQLLAKYPLLDVHIVDDAFQGLYSARTIAPDLIILDVNLPDIDGCELVEILKQDTATKDIPVIALSANVLSHDIKKGEEAGFDFYLTKPINLGQLISIFNTLL